jgi:hypothetical protein
MHDQSAVGPPMRDDRETRPGDSERGPPSAVRVFASRLFICLRDKLHIVRHAFAHPRSGDRHEQRFLLKLGNGSYPTITHA